MEKDQLTSEFIEQSVFRLQECTPRIKKCMDMLTETEIWKRPNESSNSVGNLLLHLNGNITQYILSSLGKLADIRTRDAEFEAQGGFTKTELFNKLQTTVNVAVSVIRRLDANALLAKRSVQGFALTGVGIIIHVVEHYSYHTGQIAFWTKLLKDHDLGFYAGVDLNKKNKI